MKILTSLKTNIIFKIKRWNRKIALSKRQQFVIVTIILTLGMVFTQLVSNEFRYPMVILLSVFTFGLFAFALRDEFEGIEWLTLLTLPTLFTCATGIFYFLLPIRWITRIPVATIYALGIYALLLTENIYNIAAIRTIALVRAAHSVGFLITLVTFYLLTHSLLLTRLNLLFNAFGTFFITFLLSVQLLWAINLEEKISHKIIILSSVSAFIIGELGFYVSLIPSTITFATLFLTTCFYVLSGMMVQYLQDKLYKKTLTEFLFVIIIVLFIYFAGISWR